MNDYYQEMWRGRVVGGRRRGIPPRRPDGGYQTMNIENEYLSPLVQEAIRIGAVIERVEQLNTTSAGDSPQSSGFIPITVNADKINETSIDVSEKEQQAAFRFYCEKLVDKRVLIESLADQKTAKLIKPSDASRYFPNGRKRIKARIFKRLGKWFNCPGLLLSLTFDPKKICRYDAWQLVGLFRREFISRVNRWRIRHGMPKATFLAVIEAQKGTGYPHVHLVFPHLRWLAPLDFLTETWGQAPNSVDVKTRDSMSPVSYVCKYISKLEGWSELALSYIWINKTRLYSLSRDYVLPDYSDKRVPEWVFKRGLDRIKAAYFITNDMGGYETLIGTEDLVSLMLTKENKNEKTTN